MSDNKKPIVFVCHASEDEHFVSALMNMLTSIGIEHKSIVCTSNGKCGLRNGKNWNDQLREKFTKFDPYVIIIHSNALYKSAVAMNEMGAAWVMEHKVYSFLVNGFEVKSMKGVFASTHQATVVSKVDITGDVDDLYEDLQNHLLIKKLDCDKWKQIRDYFIDTIKAIPANVSAPISEDEIDLDETIHIQSNMVDYLSDEVHTEDRYVTIGELLKESYHVLSRPQTEYALREYVSEKYGGVTEDCWREIQGKFHAYGLIGMQTGQTEEGQYVAWSLTNKGWKAYEMACKYKISKWQKDRDKKTMLGLMKAFSTNSMDDYLMEGPDYMDSILIISVEMWSSIYNASSTIIYQDTLKQVLGDFVQLWTGQMSHGELYIPCNNNRYKLGRSLPSSCTEEARKAIEQLERNMPPLRKAYQNLIKYVKKAYPDFDLGMWSAEFEANMLKNSLK